MSTGTEKAGRMAVITYFYFNHQLQAANLAIELILVGMENVYFQNERTLGSVGCFLVYVL